VLQVSRYVRKPFVVEAVQVTVDNMIEVSAWCEGEIKQASDGTSYIKVNVNKPQNERQTMAFVNNWVLRAETGYKVFTNKPFQNSYEEYFEPRCNNTTTTVDGKPCVLGKGHRSWPNATGCRSLQDYKILTPLMPTAATNVNFSKFAPFMDPNAEVM